MEKNIQAKKKIYHEITIAKGIGILLVVLGHAMKQTGMTDQLTAGLIQLIYSFHMPLFFVLSGFVSVKILDYGKKEEIFPYIRNRAIRLLIPYFVMGILYMPLKFLLSRFARNPYDFTSAWKLIIGENPNTTMWFLFTLFWVSVIALILVRKAVLLPMLTMTAVLSAVSFFFGWEMKIPKYLFFFIFGLYLREYYQRFLEMGKRKGIIAVLALLFVAGNVGLAYGVLLAGMVTAVSGSLLCLLFSLWLSRKTGRMSRSLQALGESSMDIYILSDPVQTAARLVLWNILHLSNVVVIVLCFVAGIALSYILAKYVFRKFKIFRILLFGEQ